MADEHEVGRTADVGFEIGVSRTIPFPPDVVWRHLTRPEGLAVWLGEGAELGRERGAAYETDDGTVGEVRSFRELDRIRLTWRPRGWDHDTTVQVAVVAGTTPDKASLRFHQEWLADGAERERQRTHWQDVVARLVESLGEG